MSSPSPNAAHVDVLRRLRDRAPRVQCLTNTVAQAITANALHALGARASMATHPDEVVAMTASADGVLINLGTPDQARLDALTRLLEADALRSKPCVLDPVFVHASLLRQRYAVRLCAHMPLIIKANMDEATALRADVAGDDHVWITTGAVDRLTYGGTQVEFAGGHRWMSAVTGLGCALGAVVAACATVSDDRAAAAATALSLFKRAGELAAGDAAGPGTFAAAFLDRLERLSMPGA